MDFHTLSRRELQVLCKRNGVRANMTNAAMAEVLESLEPLDLVDGINYEMAPIPILVPAPTVTTRLTVRRSLSRKTEVVVSNPVPAILRRSQRRVMRKTLDQEPKGEDDITEVKERAASKMPQAKLTYETSEYDDDLDEDEEWALNDDDSAEELSSTDESDEVTGETHHEFDDEKDSGPDLEVLKELLNDLKGVSLKKLRDTYNELKDKQII